MQLSSFSCPTSLAYLLSFISSVRLTSCTCSKDLGSKVKSLSQSRHSPDVKQIFSRDVSHWPWPWTLKSVLVNIPNFFCISSQNMHSSALQIPRPSSQKTPIGITWSNGKIWEAFQLGRDVYELELTLLTPVANPTFAKKN